MDNFKPITVIFGNIDKLDLSKLHISLLILLKSELNMKNKIKIYVRTKENILIDINSHIDLPLSLSDFNDLFKYLLDKLKAKNKEGLVLMSIVKNKIDTFLAPNCYKLNLNVKGKMFSLDDKLPYYTLFIDFEEEENDNIELVRLSDFKMDSIGITSKILNVFENFN